AGKLLAFDNVGFAQTFYISKFYEVIQEVPGVIGVNITEFSCKKETPPVISKDGKIILEKYEIAIMPNDPGDKNYLNGVWVKKDKSDAMVNPFVH
ncbi:MAG: hypothetical protein GY757_22910, partial [bacterium]|nr:hypothetical protein [bacterium]